MSATLSLMFALCSPVSAETFEDTPIEEAEAAGEVAADSVAPAPAHAPALKDPVTWTLDDGTTVVLVEDHRVPLVEVRLAFPAGSWTPWFREGGGQEAFVDSFYDSEGSLRARADALAANFDFTVLDQRSVLEVSCLKRDLPEVLELLADVLANTDYDPGELKRDQKNSQIGWKSAQKDPNFRAVRASAELLFAEGDARRMDVSEPLDVVQDIDRLVATRDTLVRLPGRTLGFAGDFTREEVDALAGNLLPEASAAPPVSSEPAFLPLGERPEASVELMPNLTQVYFAWFREGLTWDDPDYASWVVADHVLGGHFYSRLYVALRHEGGETYGARTQREGAAEPRGYGLGTFTRTDNKATTEEKLRKVMVDLRAEGITQEELDEAVSSLRGELLFGRQAPGQVLGEAMWELGNGLEPGFEEAVVEAAEALSLEEVNAFITRFYDPAAFTMLTVEPEG